MLETCSLFSRISSGFQEALSTVATGPCEPFQGERAVGEEDLGGLGMS